MKRPAWWNQLHDTALATLTPEWQSVRALCPAVGRATAFHALEDLAVCGAAEERRERITSPSGQAAGERIFFRLGGAT